MPILDPRCNVVAECRRLPHVKRGEGDLPTEEVADMQSDAQDARLLVVLVMVDLSDEF